jgi:hypothetical protein
VRKIHYRPGRLSFAVFGWGAIGAAFLYLGVVKGSSLAVFGGAFCGYFAFAAGRTAFADRPALAWDEAGLTINTPHRSAHFSWSQIRNIAIETITLRYWGIIPIARQQHLTIAGDRGLTGSTWFRLTPGHLQLPPGGVDALHAMLFAARLAAIGEAGIATAGTGRHGRGVAPAQTVEPATPAEKLAGSDFDADAAFARYLAQRQREDSASAAVPHAPARPTFGRRGV